MIRDFFVLVETDRIDRIRRVNQELSLIFGEFGGPVIINEYYLGLAR